MDGSLNQFTRRFASIFLKLDHEPGAILKSCQDTSGYNRLKTIEHYNLRAQGGGHEGANN